METQHAENLQEAINQNQNEPNKKRPGTLDEIVIRLDKAYAKTWVNHLSIINEVLKGKSESTRINRAKALSLYCEVLSLRNDEATKYKLADIHRAIQTFPIDKPKLTRYNKFEEFVNRGQGKSVNELTNYLIDKSRGTGNSKIGEGLRNLIYAFYADPRKLNFKRIAELVSHAVREEVKNTGVDSAINKWDLPNTFKTRQRLEQREYLSASTVKKLITPEVRNTYCRSRYGAKEFHQTQITPLHRTPAQFALDRVEFDSTVFSFVFYDKASNKVSIKLVTCLVIDSHSGRIIGYAFAKAESANMVIEALRNSFVQLSYLPAEIFTDRFPGHNNEEIKYFINQIKSLGCRFEIERTGNARAKGLVEVTINNLCELAKEDKNFIGKNITTKNRDSRLSVEFTSKYYNVDNRMSIEQVKDQIIDLIALYNSRAAVKQNEDRRTVFNNSQLKNAIPLTLESSVWLFHKVLVKKVEQGLISFRKGHNRYIYSIADPIHRLRLNGTQVKVRFNESDFESKNEIWVFDNNTDELICTCSQQLSPFVAKANQTDKDTEIFKQNRKDKKELVEIVKVKELELDHTSIEVSNYIMSSKIEQTNLEELHLLRQMTERPIDVNANIKTFKNDDDEVVGIVRNPHGRVLEEDDSMYDRLNGYEEDMLEPEPIMLINRLK
jgi:hypothetical protein